VRGCRGVGRVVRCRVSTVGGCYWRQTEIIVNSLSTTSRAIRTYIVWLARHRWWKDGRVRILLRALPRVLPCSLRAVLRKGAVRARRRRLRIVRIRRACCWLSGEGTKRLAMGAKELSPLRVDIRTRSTVWPESHIPHIWVDCVSWDKSLRLRGDWSEDTLLLEALAI
jgi:hypothetical protein